MSPSIRIRPRPLRQPLIVAASLGVLALGAPVSSALVTATWTGPAIGTWETAANWSSLTVPNNGGGTTYSVVVDAFAGQASLVLLTSAVQVQTVQVNAGDTVRIVSNGQLGVVGGGITNSGTIQLVGAEALSSLRCDADVSLTGLGVLEGGVEGSNRIIGAHAGVRLTQAAGHTIRGSMLLGSNVLRLTNAGLVDANTGFGIQMDLSDTGTNFNSGTMRASNAALLRVLNTTIDNTGGVIEATTGGLVAMSTTTVQGGTLRDADGDGPASLQNWGISTLQDVTVEGTFQALDSTTTKLRGFNTINGVLSVQASTAQTDVVIDSAVCTLSGAGTLLLSDSLINRVYGAAGGNRLVIGPDFTVRGAGQFGLDSMLLTNHGLLQSDFFHDLIVVLSDDELNVNTGTIRCSEGQTLSL
ncbi:MAG: hypothetical protein JNK53_08700, partial [Phycisphaerae bacterium]|nr:hypothetical protein [Phycisphaerae bacterium]